MSEAKLPSKKKFHQVIEEDSDGNEQALQSTIALIIKRCQEIEKMEQMPIYQSMVLTTLVSTGLAVAFERLSACIVSLVADEPEQFTIPLSVMAMIGYDALVAKVKYVHGVAIDATYNEIETNLSILCQLVENNLKNAKAFIDLLNQVIKDELNPRWVHHPFKELVSAFKSIEDTARIKKSAVAALKLINQLLGMSAKLEQKDKRGELNGDDNPQKEQIEESIGSENSSTSGEDEIAESDTSEDLRKDEAEDLEDNDTKPSVTDKTPLENKYSLRRSGAKHPQDFGEQTSYATKDDVIHHRKSDKKLTATKFNARKFKKALKDNNLSELESQLRHIDSSQTQYVLDQADRHLSLGISNPKTRQRVMETVKFIKNYIILKNSETKKKSLKLKSNQPKPTIKAVLRSQHHISDSSAPAENLLTDSKTPDKKSNSFPGLLTLTRSPKEALAALMDTVKELKIRKFEKNDTFMDESVKMKALQFEPSPYIKLYSELAFELMAVLQQLSPKCVVYGVGGWSLCMLQGLEDLSDIDLVTNLNADDLIKTLKNLKDQDKSFYFKQYSQLDAQVVFEIKYKGTKFDLQADPSIRLRPDGQLDRLSLVENANKRNYNINGIFIDSNGEFPIIFPEIEQLILNKEIEDNEFKVKASSGHLVNVDIASLIPDWKSKFLKNNQGVVTESFASELEITVKNYIADPKRMFALTKLQNKSQLSRQKLHPAINRVFSDPELMKNIFIASVKIDKSNIMHMVLGLENLLKALLSAELNTPGVRHRAIPEKKLARPQSSPTATILPGQNFPVSEERIRIDLLLPACRQHLKNFWKEIGSRCLFLFALQAQVADTSAKQLEAGCQFLFRDNDSERSKRDNKTKSMVKFDPNEIQNWLLDRLIKVNIVASLNSFRDQISLGLSDIFPCRPEKILPLVMAVWWQQNQGLTEFPTTEDFRTSLTQLIAKFPFFKRAFSTLTDFKTIIDDAYTGFCKDLGITPVGAVVTTGEVAGNQSSMPASASSSASSSVSSKSQSLLPAQHSNSASYWSNKTGGEKPADPVTQLTSDNIASSVARSGNG